MKKCVLMPDSFKGTMSSIEICGIMEKKINEIFPGCEVVKLPVADGGEGSVDSFLLAMPGERITCKVKGPFMEEVDSFYGLIDGGKTAVIEMAACAGLPMVENCKDPMRTTTYGVGELMLDACSRGCNKIIVAIGGSSTNEGGTGMAAALGVKFLDSNGREFIPLGGGDLTKIAKIDASGVDPRIAKTEIVIMCDVDNPLCGENGASAIFGPQKGADPEMVKALDAGLMHLAGVIKNDLKLDVLNNKGSGAAGGLGAGLVAFAGGTLRPGIDIVLDTVRFEEQIAGADMIFTGEGKIDGQSLRGKVVVGISRRAMKLGVPVTAVVGDIGDGTEGAYDVGVTAIVSINALAIPFKEARPRAKSDMAMTMGNILRLIKAAEKK